MANGARGTDTAPVEADPATLALALGHKFADPDLLLEALTHPSRAQGRRTKRLRGRDYDRLEFVGDRVLGLIVAEWLFQRFPEAEAGELARRLNALVRQESLARVAETIGLGPYLRLSRSERDVGGAAKPALLANACEAVIAALFIDGGLKAARKFVLACLEPLLDAMDTGAKDPKTALQEWAAARALTPAYAVASQEGPPHEPVFTVTVTVKGKPPATGRGSSKRIAEQAAASVLLQELTRK